MQRVRIRRCAFCAEDGTLDPEMVNLITGDCVEEMWKMPPKWYHCIITSFPYWPARRVYSSRRQADRLRPRANL